MVTVRSVGRPTSNLKRLWRVRRGHDAIDAVLIEEPRDCQVRFDWNGRALVTLSFPDVEAARVAADDRRQELVRAGWVTHW